MRYPHDIRMKYCGCGYGCGCQNSCGYPRMRIRMRSSDTPLTLTISFGPVFQAECEGEGGIVLEKFRSEGIPPEVVRVLPTTRATISSQEITSKAFQ